MHTIGAVSCDVNADSQNESNQKVISYVVSNDTTDTTVVSNGMTNDTTDTSYDTTDTTSENDAVFKVRLEKFPRVRLNLLRLFIHCKDEFENEFIPWRLVRDRYKTFFQDAPAEITMKRNSYRLKDDGLVLIVFDQKSRSGNKYVVPSNIQKRIRKNFGKLNEIDGFTQSDTTHLYDTKNDTTKIPYKIDRSEEKSILSILKADPELKYWSQLDVRDILGWAKEFSTTPHDILQGLRHCRYDLIENGKEKEVTTGPKGWFHGRLKIYSYYAAPAGYKSADELELERLQKQKKRNEEIAERLAKERNEHWKSRLNVEFEQMMLAGRGSSLFDQIFELMPDHAKKYVNTPQNPVFEVTMRGTLQQFREGEFATESTNLDTSEALPKQNP